MKPLARGLALVAVWLGAVWLLAGCGSPPAPIGPDGPPEPPLDEVHERYAVAIYSGTEMRAQSQVLVDLDLRQPTEVRLRARLLGSNDVLTDWSVTSGQYHLEPGTDAASAVLVMEGLVFSPTLGVKDSDLTLTELRIGLRQITGVAVQATFPSEGLPIPFPLTVRALSLERELVVR